MVRSTLGTSSRRPKKGKNKPASTQIALNKLRHHAYTDKRKPQANDERHTPAWARQNTKRHPPHQRTLRVAWCTRRGTPLRQGPGPYRRWWFGGRRSGTTPAPPPGHTRCNAQKLRFPPGGGPWCPRHTPRFLASSEFTGGGHREGFISTIRSSNTVGGCL